MPILCCIWSRSHEIGRIEEARSAQTFGAPAEVQALLDGRTEPRTFGLLGEPRVNVLLLNLELDKRFGAWGSSLRTPSR